MRPLNTDILHQPTEQKRSIKNILLKAWVTETLTASDIMYIIFKSYN